MQKPEFENSKPAAGRAQTLAFISATTMLGVLVGFNVSGNAAALLCGCAGLIFGWAIRKGALVAGFRGAMLGAAFATIVGPGADHFVNGVPFTDKLKPALVIGSLVGGLLGVRNFRPPRNRDLRPIIQSFEQ